MSAVFVSILMASCSSRIVEFELINRSNSPIYNVDIFTSSEKSFHRIDSISAKESKQINLNMYREPTADGSYSLSYIQNSIPYDFNFGYYTNGSPITEKYILYILKDSISVQEILHDNY
jgi:hypothetical protein